MESTIASCDVRKGFTIRKPSVTRPSCISSLSSAFAPASIAAAQITGSHICTPCARDVSGSGKEGVRRRQRDRQSAVQRDLVDHRNKCGRRTALRETQKLPRRLDGDHAIAQCAQDHVRPRRFHC